MHPNLSVIKGGQLLRDDLIAEAAREHLLRSATSVAHGAAWDRGWAFRAALAVALVTLSRASVELLRTLSAGAHR